MRVILPLPLAVAIVVFIRSSSIAYAGPLDERPVGAPQHRGGEHFRPALVNEDAINTNVAAGAQGALVGGTLARP